MIRCYLINLERSVARLAHMQSVFGAMSIPFHRVEAVDGAAMSSAEFASHAGRIGRADGREWTRGKVGCYLSHRRVWGLVASAAAGVAAVFEDDLHAAPTLSSVLQAADWLPADADIVRLETTPFGVRLGRAKSVVAGRSVRPVLSRTFGSAAYLLTKAAAEKLATATVEYYSVDFTLFNSKESAIARTLRVYQLDPAPCTQDAFHPDSGARIGLASEIVRADPLGGSFAGAILRKALRRALGRKAVEFA